MMTQKQKSSSPWRRRVLYGAIVCLIILVSWIAYFLATFNLDNYRDTIEQELTKLLSQRVHITEIGYHFNYTHLALQASGVKVGDSETQVLLEIPELLIDLQWRGLLIKDFRVSRIHLNHPQLWYRSAQADRPPEVAGEKETLKNLDLSLFGTLKIDSLKVNKGNLLIEQPDGRRFKVALDTAEIDDVQLNTLSTALIKGSVLLPEQTSSTTFVLHGEFSLSVNQAKNLVPFVDMALEMESLDLGSAAQHLPEQLNSLKISGTTQLQLDLTGPTEGAFAFQAEMTSSGIEVMQEDLDISASFQSLFANGRYLPQPESQQIEEFSLRVDQSHLAGAVRWTTGRQPFALNADLSNVNLDLTELKRWLPKTPDFLKIIEKTGETGALYFEHAGFSIRQNSDGQALWEIDRLKGEIHDLSWSDPDLPMIKVPLLPFNIRQQHFTIDPTVLKVGHLDIVLEGNGQLKENHIDILAMNFSSTAAVENLIRDWDISTGSFLFAGAVPVKGHLEGPLDRIILDLDFDLSALQLSHPSGVSVQPGDGDKLSLHATLSSKVLTIDHSSFVWSFAKGRMNADYTFADPESLYLNALVDISDLENISRAVPVLSSYQLKGEAELTVVQQGAFHTTEPEIILSLRDAGARVTPYIADLNKVTGRIKVTSSGFSADNLNLFLGESALSATAEFQNFHDPLFILRVYGSQVRAQDVVFYSEKAMLQDVKGQLRFDKSGLYFEPVNVTLEGGTRASVRGSVSFTPPYDVTLDVKSQFANIAEVINLWADRPEADKVPKSTPDSSKEQEPSNEAKSVIAISADIDEGDLYGMAFQSAKGVVVPSKERLIIHPLDFSIGEGECTAQVVTDFRKDQPSQIRISGHAVNVDAYEVHNGLLNRKSVIRGALDTDFFLYGDIGKNFLPTSNGHAWINIKNGVLREFKILSKVFSFLNVGQLFRFKFPEMDAEGMPFSLISGNYLLKNGVLSTDDLVVKSQSMNQAYSGQVDLVSKEVNVALVVQPLGTVDAVLSKIPVAGWLLTGENGSFVTALFKATGTTEDLQVEAMPLNTVTEPTFGLLRRTLGLPVKLLKDPQILWGGDATER